jgi:hypothetical protein
LQIRAWTLVMLRPKSSVMQVYISSISIVKIEHCSIQEFKDRISIAFAPFLVERERTSMLGDGLHWLL